MRLIQGTKYRKDIDALRALAVLAVMLFHCDCLPNGFLGVDIFFVISGYLITGIIVANIDGDTFSIKEFYIRRIRRIIPLALFVSMVALLVGMCTMLPDDLENLAESVIATNVFGNNVLQAITTKNYWDIVNEYKPLMHTWSLGVEEQFYLVYPLLLCVVVKKSRKLVLPGLLLVTSTSLFLYIAPGFQEFEKFYLVMFRLWELGAGGIVSIIFRDKVIVHRYPLVLVFVLIALLCLNASLLNKSLALVLIVLTTVGILASANHASYLSKCIFENTLLVGIGRISFSLYMWHQVLLAYVRYLWVQEMRAHHVIAIVSLAFMLSSISYLVIEQPYRDAKRVSTTRVLYVLACVWIITSSVSAYIYMHAGILRDVPELDIRAVDATRSMHAKYNARVHSCDTMFVSADKIRVLVIGNSFARDWANVLMESTFASNLEVSYINDADTHVQFNDRVTKADVIFVPTLERVGLEKFGAADGKVFVVGTKNFGTSNGIYYNYRGVNYYGQRTKMERGYLETNVRMRHMWGNRYIDYIAKIIDHDSRVPVFTPSRKFISQDCRHFTKAGAQYFAKLFEEDLQSIFAGKSMVTSVSGVAPSDGPGL